MKLVILATLVLCFTSCGVIVQAKPKIGEYFDDPKIQALYRAVGRSPKKVEKLIGDGADINARGKENMTLLLFSVLNAEDEKYYDLLANGADPNVIWESSWRTFDNVMQMVARDENSRFLEAALMHGGNPNLKAKDGSTPLEEALSATQKTNARILVENGADPDLPGESSTSPAIRALSRNLLDLTMLFLKSGSEWGDEEGKVKWDYVYYLSRFEGTTDRAPQIHKKKIELIDWMIAQGAVFDDAFLEVLKSKKRELGIPEPSDEGKE